MTKVCQYCCDNPVAAEWNYSCVECVYVCETCDRITPYEIGGDSEDCDDCWAAKQTPEVCANCDYMTFDMRGDFCKDCDKERQTGEME